MQGNNSHFTRGGQILFHSVRMWMQVNTTLMRYIALFVVALTLLLTYLSSPPNTFRGVFYYWRNAFYEKFGKRLDSTVTTTWDGQQYHSTLSAQLNNPVISDLNGQFWYALQVNALISIVLGLILFALGSKLFSHLGNKQSQDNHIRGFRKGEPKDVERDIKQKAKKLKKKGVGNGKPSTFSLDGYRLFKRNFEIQHLGLVGTSGAGKSVCIRKVLHWIRQRGDKAIVYDKGCTFIGQFYDPQTDVVLNPFDERCAHWDVWCDAREASDFENIASALIPQHGEGDPFWVESARTIFSSTAYQMSKDKKPCTTERLLHLMLTSELETLGQYLKGTESASLVSNKIEKTAISIKSVLATFVKSLRFLDGLDEKDDKGELKRKKFSITDWVQDDNKSGFLFLSSNAMQHTSLRPLLSTWLAIASTAILGMEADENRRVWIIMDEMPSLHKLPELLTIISEVRKFGGCYLIGFQNYAQLYKTYGRNAADAILDLINTRFYFRSPYNEMAKISSADIGEEEVDVSRENISYGANTLRDGVSLGHDTKTRPLYSTSEIQGLDDLQCCIRVPNSKIVTQMDLKIDAFPSLCQGFIKRSHTESKEMLALYNDIVYHEIIAPNTLLDEASKDALSKMQAERYDSEDEQRADVLSMKQAMNESVRSTSKENNSDESNYQEEANRELNEAAISQDLGEFSD